MAFNGGSATFLAPLIVKLISSIGIIVTLYIVGGGARNKWLNELTQQFCNIRVVALPIEATALGNLSVQMKQ